MTAPQIDITETPEAKSVFVAATWLERERSYPHGNLQAHLAKVRAAKLELLKAAADYAAVYGTAR